MAYSLDSDGHLDLSPCFMGFGCDKMLAAEISREYFFSEMQGLVAWDGTRIAGLEHEGTWVKLVAKHKARRKPFNPVCDLDLERVKRLPVLKMAVTGGLAVDVYAQCRDGGQSDAIQVVVSGIDENYVVVLGRVRQTYVLRSAYMGDEGYTRKIVARGSLMKEIRP